MSENSQDAKTEFHEPPRKAGSAGEETVDLQPGGIPQQIGPYEILGVLGQGGMGAVYRARDPSLQREVALKVLPPNVAADTEQTERFLREARVAARINSPHVITVHAVGEDNGLPYMALELVAGGDVDELTRGSPDGRLPERRALEVARDCARGLIAIERAGLVHRDIKPANVFLTEDGVAKLADLGLARSHSGEDQLTQTGTIVGTPAYMAPEQARGDRVDIRTDIYALGATLFGIVTGQAPFQGSSVFVIVSNVLNEPMPDPARLRPDLSDTTADLIRRACAKEPADRFDSAQELLDAIEHALEVAPRGRRIGSSRSALAPTVAVPAPQTARRGPRQAPVALAVGGGGQALAPPARPPTPWRWIGLFGCFALLSCCCLTPLLNRDQEPDPEPSDLALKTDAQTSTHTPAPPDPVDPDGPTAPIEGPKRWLKWTATEVEAVSFVTNPARVAYDPGYRSESKIVFTDRRAAPWPLPTGEPGPGQPKGSFSSWRAWWTIHRVEVQRRLGFTVVLGARQRNDPLWEKSDIGPAVLLELTFVRVRPRAKRLMVTGRVVAVNKDAVPRDSRPLSPRPGVEVLAHITAVPYDPHRPVQVVMDLNRFALSVWVEHAGVERGTNRVWSKMGQAVITDEFEEGVYLFGAMGNMVRGQGRAGLSLEVFDHHIQPPDKRDRKPRDRHGRR